MNFDCVGRDSNGQLYMKRHIPYNIVEKIQILQRYMLVKWFSYYNMEDGIFADFQYIENSRQLKELSKSYPKEFKRSRYYTYFHDFYDSDNTSSCYALINRVKKLDPKLYARIERDAFVSLKH